MIGTKIRCVVAMLLGALSALGTEPGRAAQAQAAPDTQAAPGAQSAAAAQQNAADLRYRRALDAMLTDVASPEASFEFVQAATAVGDLRGALAALERMLLINPNLANIQLELGALYLQLGNPMLGRYHVTRALQAPDVPGVVRARAERYLALAGAQAGRNFLHGGLSVAWRHESDANFAPNSDLVSVFDPFLGRAVLGQLGSDARARADSSLLLAGQLNHSLALGSGAVSWDTSLQADASRYQQLTGLNEMDVHLESGPNFVLNHDPEAPFGLRPFAAGTDSWLDQQNYIRAYGGGVELSRRYGTTSSVQLRAQMLHEEFLDRPDGSLFISDRTGNYGALQLNGLRQQGRLQFGWFLGGESSSTAARYQSYDRWSGGGSVRMYFASPWQVQPWNLGLSASAERSGYRAPDPIVDPLTTRRDTLAQAALSAELPVTRLLSVSLTGAYLDNTSNLPNFASRDVSIRAALNMQF